jgi:beta-glucosidase/6-phospho-beta-glucosidase/beta-galactosidase
VNFSKDFAWGAAMSSYQIEGGTEADGRGPSVWDEFCSKPGRVQGGHSGAVACDHYQRFQEDVKLMAEMGLRAYRFSVAWTRVLAEGKGAINGRGSDFTTAWLTRFSNQKSSPG